MYRATGPAGYTTLTSAPRLTARPTMHGLEPGRLCAGSDVAGQRAHQQPSLLTDAQAKNGMPLPRYLTSVLVAIFTPASFHTHARNVLLQRCFCFAAYVSPCHYNFIHGMSGPQVPAWPVALCGTSRALTCNIAIFTWGHGGWPPASAPPATPPHSKSLLLLAVLQPLPHFVAGTCTLHMHHAPSHHVTLRLPVLSVVQTDGCQAPSPNSCGSPLSSQFRVRTFVQRFSQ